MIQLKFNSYFNLPLYPNGDGTSIPFEVDETVIVKLRFAFAQNVDDDAQRTEVYDSIEVRMSMAFLVDEWAEDDTRFCDVYRVKDKLTYKLALDDDARISIEAILTNADKLIVPFNEGQMLKVPFRVSSVTYLWGTDQVVSIVPQGIEDGKLIISEVEMIE